MKASINIDRSHRRVCRVSSSMKVKQQIFDTNVCSETYTKLGRWKPGSLSQGELWRAQRPILPDHAARAECYERLPGTRHIP